MGEIMGKTMMRSKGRVLIPANVRKIFSLKGGDIIIVTRKGNEIILKKL